MFGNLNQQARAAALTLASLCFFADRAAGQEGVGGDFSRPQGALRMPAPLTFANSLSEISELQPLRVDSSFFHSATPIRLKHRLIWPNGSTEVEGVRQITTMTVEPCDNQQGAQTVDDRNNRHNFRYYNMREKDFYEIRRNRAFTQWEQAGYYVAWSDKNNCAIAYKNGVACYVLVAETRKPFPSCIYDGAGRPIRNQFGIPLVSTGYEVLHDLIPVTVAPASDTKPGSGNLGPAGRGATDPSVLR